MRNLIKEKYKILTEKWEKVSLQTKYTIAVYLLMVVSLLHIFRFIEKYFL